MKSIRIGKDIEVRWSILTNGQPISLSGRCLTLILQAPNFSQSEIKFSTVDNIVVFIYSGRDQISEGIYSLSLWENKGQKRQTVVDQCDAFRLVATTCQEKGIDEGLETSILELESSKLEVGLPIPGVPAGGHTGQVLTKATDKNFDTEWRNPSGGGITPEELGRIALRYDSLQSLSTKDQSTALKNIGLPTFIVSYSELPKVLTDAEAESLELAALLRVDNYPSSNGSRTLILESYPTYNSRVGFQTRMDGSRVLYVNYEKATKTLSVAAGFLTDINAVSFQFQQKLTPTQRYIARTNIFSVGYLQLSATLGTDADNWPLVVTSSLAEVQAAFEQFWANPGRYRWSLVINSSADMNPFVEEAELEPLHRDDGGLELQFTSKKSGLRYAIVLTREEFVITAVRVENRLREEWKAYLAAGASFDPLTGYFKVNEIEDIPLREIEAMYALYDGRKQVNLPEQFANSTVRTTFPIRTQWATVNMDRTFQNCLRLSQVAISTFPGSMMFAFYNCPKLERIIGVLDLWFAAVAATTNAFDGCAQLRSVSINRLRNSIGFKDSPHLSLESLQYLISHAANTAAITVTVHPDVYARLLDPTQAEWYALNEQAAARNIAFATL